MAVVGVVVITISNVLYSPTLQHWHFNHAAIKITKLHYFHQRRPSTYNHPITVPLSALTSYHLAIIHLRCSGINSATTPQLGISSPAAIVQLSNYTIAISMGHHCATQLWRRHQCQPPSLNIYGRCWDHFYHSQQLRTLAFQPSPPLNPPNYFTTIDSAVQSSNYDASINMRQPLSYNHLVTAINLNYHHRGIGEGAHSLRNNHERFI